MLFEYSLKTSVIDFIDITPSVREVAAKSGVTDGIAVVYCPHTTAGITVNENADADVARDILLGLDKAFPDRREFRHSEGNSAAHIKASVIGSSATVIINGGRLLLGTWQGVYFCEFDPPRGRKFFVKIFDSKTAVHEITHGN
jgi:secondary thiamine-phosphate synthase enzyme